MPLKKRRDMHRHTGSTRMHTHKPAFDVSLYLSFEGPESWSNILRSFSLFSESKVFKAWILETRDEKVLLDLY